MNALIIEIANGSQVLVCEIVKSCVLGVEGKAFGQELSVVNLYAIRDRRFQVSPWKGIIRFGKRGKLSPRFLGPFKVLTRVRLQAYKLELPPEMAGIHNTFHVCYLRKCLVEEESVIPLLEIRVDENNRSVEEPEAILESKIKVLRHKEVVMVKIRV
ncbi:uncharacterized protein LOC112500000 [Cynara cardunculus var. scolymus]|uniref:uncharacterized protein LOC112500000 n=1 Tax=Cynara cardunculus var. scolymus TaxID=59895 RepID=UPI000D62BEA7|nr:uncharacterized protein LOC112500000 [Cynara cardunculus var. scolymus]